MRAFKLSLLINALSLVSVAHAAVPVNLRLQTGMAFSAGVQLKQVRKQLDAHKITHIHFEQTYRGLPVFGASVIKHIPVGLAAAATMNGRVYEGLDKDLQTQTLVQVSAQQALAVVKTNFQKEHALDRCHFTQESAHKIVFVDAQNTAHYAYLVSAYVDDGVSGAKRPTMIVDASSLHVYRQWDEVLNEVRDVGGIGGNIKIGHQIYDGGQGHLSALKMSVDKTAAASRCVMDTADIIVEDASNNYVAEANDCLIDDKHQHIYWLDQDENGTRWLKDEINDGYSPSIDAFYAASVIKQLYQDWYGVPPLVEADHETPMKLIMRVHYGYRFDNAFWDGRTMTFGDGGDYFYPLVALDVSAHEISHGFTAQNGHLNYYGQMMGLNESFSDMASAAAEYYSTGKNSWRLGESIYKGDGALRYLDEPTKDGVSIDHMKDYVEYMDGHYSSGITNRAFYLLATTPGWNTRKAFDVMVQANRFYWNQSMDTFAEGACGVVAATRDLGYSVADVKAAFDKVGLETPGC